MFIYHVYKHLNPSNLLMSIDLWYGYRCLSRFIDVKMELVAINDRQETLGIFSWYFKTTAWWLQDFGWSLLEHYLQMKDFHSHVWLPEGSSSLSLFFQFLEERYRCFFLSLHWSPASKIQNLTGDLLVKPVRWSMAREVDAAERGTCTWTAWYRGPPCRWICPSMAATDGFWILWMNPSQNELWYPWLILTMDTLW